MIRIKTAKAMFENWQLVVAISGFASLLMSHRWVTAAAMLTVVIVGPWLFSLCVRLSDNLSVERVVKEQAEFQQQHAGMLLSMSRPCWQREKSVEQIIAEWQRSSLISNA